MITGLPPAAGDAVLAYILNAAWELPLIGVAGLTALRFAPPRAALGCRAWIAALILGALAPALSAAAWTLEPPSGPKPVADLATHVAEHGRTARLLTCAAALATTLAALRLGAAVWQVRRLVARSTPLRLAPALSARLRLFAARHGRSMPAVRLCPDLTGPAVAGVRRPVVLLPSDFERLGEEQACAALLHECAHAFRRDYVSNLLCEALALPLSWHPVVYLLKQRLRAEREVACDRLAARGFGGRIRYARALVQLAQATDVVREQMSLMPRLLGPGGLEERVRALLAPSAQPGRHQAIRTGAAALAGAALLAPLVCLRLAPDGPVIEPHTVARVPAFYPRALLAQPVSPYRAAAKRIRLARWRRHPARPFRLAPALVAPPVELARTGTLKSLVQAPPVVVLVRIETPPADAVFGSAPASLLLLAAPSVPACIEPAFAPPSPIHPGWDDAITAAIAPPRPPSDACVERPPTTRAGDGVLT
jgi:beta-lactamase regulating signal transducer with metallopeptidase domain